MSIFVQARERTRGAVSGLLVTYALLMAVIFAWAILGANGPATLAGFIVSAVTGLFLGWRRRAAAVVVAPAISWFFGALPILVASMIHGGVVSGFFHGLFLDTVGWLAIAFAEFVTLGFFAFLGRVLRGRPREGDVIITPPTRA